MKTHTRNRLMSMAAATALGLALSSSVLAQTDAGATGMPAEQHQGSVTFVTGGVGLDESHALRAAAGHWPLSLQFTGPGSDYLSDVHVSINDAHGTELLKAAADGPYMLVRLPAGQYTIHARYKDQSQTKSIGIARSSHAKASFHWNQQ